MGMEIKFPIDWISLQIFNLIHLFIVKDQHGKEHARSNMVTCILIEMITSMFSKVEHA